MAARLKPLSQQVIVITGASSGHGLASARKAAMAGARVMRAARDETALSAVCGQIESAGGSAAYTVCDVGSEGDVERLAAATIERWGGFDTWVNNAGVGVYAEALDISTKEHRQVFETNYWGGRSRLARRGAALDGQARGRRADQCGIDQRRHGRSVAVGL